MIDTVLFLMACRYIDIDIHISRLRPCSPLLQRLCITVLLADPLDATSPNAHHLGAKITSGHAPVRALIGLPLAPSTGATGFRQVTSATSSSSRVPSLGVAAGHASHLLAQRYRKDTAQIPKYGICGVTSPGRKTARPAVSARGAREHTQALLALGNSFVDCTKTVNV